MAAPRPAQGTKDNDNTPLGPDNKVWQDEAEKLLPDAAIVEKTAEAVHVWGRELSIHRLEDHARQDQSFFQKCQDTVVSLHQ